MRNETNIRMGDEKNQRAFFFFAMNREPVMRKLLVPKL